MKNSIGKDAFNLSAAKIFTMLISLLCTMLLSRYRTLEEYGTYSQIMMVISLVTSIFMFGLPNSISYFMAKADSLEEKRKFASTYYSFSTILSFVTGLVLVLMTPLFIGYFKNELIKNFWYVLAIYPWANIILSSIDNFLIVAKKDRLLIVFKILNSVFTLATVIISNILNLDFYVYMVIFIIGEAIFSISVYLIINNIVDKIKIYLDVKLIKTIFKFSIPIGVASVIGSFKAQADNLFISWFYTTESVAIYANAAREMPVTVVTSSLTAVLLPQIVKLLNKDEKGKAIDLWRNSVALSYAFICFFALGIFTYAPEVISLLYSDKYLPGVPVFRVYCIILVLRCTYYGMLLNSIGKTKFILYSSIAALGISVILNFAFYYFLGFIGPSIANLFTTIISALILLVATCKALHVSFRNIFPWSELLKITLLNILFSVMFYWIKKAVHLEGLGGEITESIVLGIIWGIAYLLIIFKFIRRKWNALKVEE